MPWEGKEGIYALLGFVGSSQATELLWVEGEEEELRLLVLGLAELSPVTLWWPWLWDVWNLPGHGSGAGIPNLAQDFALCPSGASALGILGKLRGFLFPEGSRSHLCQGIESGCPQGASVSFPTLPAFICLCSPFLPSWIRDKTLSLLLCPG